MIERANELIALRYCETCGTVLTAKVNMCPVCKGVWLAKFPVDVLVFRDKDEKPEVLETFPYDTELRFIEEALELRQKLHPHLNVWFDLDQRAILAVFNPRKVMG